MLRHILPQENVKLAIYVFFLTILSLVVGICLFITSGKINSGTADSLEKYVLVSNYIQKNDLVNLYYGICVSPLSKFVQGDIVGIGRICDGEEPPHDLLQQASEYLLALKYRDEFRNGKVLSCIPAVTLASYDAQRNQDFHLIDDVAGTSRNFILQHLPSLKRWELGSQITLFVLSIITAWYSLLLAVPKFRRYITKKLKPNNSEAGK